MNAGINTSGRIESSHKVKSPLLFEPNIMHLDSKTTIEDILNYKKTDIQSYLKSKGKKISDTKLELAKRAYETNKYDDVNIESVVNSDPNLADEKIVPIDSLKTGWTSEIQLFPKISHNDVENYLLHSSHRTEDNEKMECYRQFIRGFNFFKEGYVHKIMINLISEDSKFCYIRSKCSPSMKQGMYNQWISISRDSPCTITKAFCSCPAGYCLFKFFDNFFFSLQINTNILLCLIMY